MTDTTLSGQQNTRFAGIVEDLNTDLLGIIRRWWRLVAVCVLVSLTLAAIYLAKTKRMYQAATRLLIIQQGGRPLNVGSNDPNAYIERAEDVLPTHIDVIRSPLVVGRAVKAVGLESLPTLKVSPHPVTNAINELKVTRPDRLARILQVEYVAGSRDESVKFLDALSESYQQWCLDTYQKNNSEIISLIGRARNMLNSELREAEQKYQDFRVEHPNEVRAVDEKGHSMVANRLGLWENAADQGRLREVQLKAQLDLGRKLARNGTELWAIAHALSQLNQLGNDSGSSMIAQAWVSKESLSADYIHRLRSEQIQLMERFSPKYSKVQALDKKIARALQRDRDPQGRNQAETRDLIASIEQSINAVQEMRTELEGRFNTDLEWAKRNERILLKDAMLHEDRDRKRELFNQVVLQLKQAQLSSDFSSVRSQVIEPSNALDSPVRPRVALTLAFALVLGLCTGTAGAVVADRRDKRFRSVEEVRISLGLAVLGNIPRLPEAQIAAAGPLELVSHALPRSPVAEAYKAVRTNLEFLRRNRRVQVILVTSPQPGDGKSTVASNLAISLAHAGRKVLLVDADLRRPVQAKAYNLPGDHGLVQILRDQWPPERVIQRTVLENVDLIASGPEVPNPAELLTSTITGEFVEKVRERYDAVIIDAPPLLAVTDPAIMGAEVDGVLLVVRLAATHRPDATRAVEMLKAIDAPILGILVNGSDREHGGYGYRYGTYGSESSSQAEAQRASTAKPGEHQEKHSNGQMQSSQSRNSLP